MAPRIFPTILIGVLYPLLAVSSSSDHVLFMWEHKDFTGECRFTLARNHNCITLAPEWRNRVSSINTNRHCYQLYEGVNCDKAEIYVYPMSKYHNDLSHMGMNDKISSIRLCVLDEQSLDNTSLPLDKNGPEFAFWNYFFGKISIPEQKAFQHLVAKHQYGYIPWNFIPGIGGKLPFAEQYQEALDWLLIKIHAHSFTMSDLLQIRKLSYHVFDERANRNAAKKAALGSRTDAITFQLEVYWKLVVEAIDSELEEKHDELEKANAKSKKILRRSRSIVSLA